MTESKCTRPYEIELTNEEWFCGLSTEEKARFLIDVELGFCEYVCPHRHTCEKHDEGRDEYYRECVYGENCTAIELREKWLKQPHHGKE